MGTQQPKEFYERLFQDGGANKSYHKHYSASNYYPAWKKVVSRLESLSPKYIFELGCGPGQFARMVQDSLVPVPAYVGIDFSSTAVQMARNNCPQGIFQQKDITSVSFDEWDYDCVVCLEVLEHIDEDLQVLRKLSRDTPIIFSVPSSDSAGHVRFFSDKDGVYERYKDVVEIYEIDTSDLNNSPDTLFIVYGHSLGNRED